MTKTIHSNHCGSASVLLELDLRRSPLPSCTTPAKYRRLRKLYLRGFEAGWRGWPLEEYFRLTSGRPHRREALDAGYHAGVALLWLFERKNRAAGIQSGDISGTDSLRKMKLRSGQLPNSWPPRQYLDECGTIETAIGAAYGSGFEAGYRGWSHLPSYRSSNCWEMWQIGFAAGEIALTKRVAEQRSSGEYAAGFQSGRTNRPLATGSKRAARSVIWRTGYEAGRRFAPADR
jgi:hypothetical protein